MKFEQWMGFSVIPVTALGAVCNWLVVIAISANRNLNHSFSMLTGTQAVFNGIFLTIYLVYVSPMIILDSKFLKEKSEYIGFPLLICYDISIQTHVIITINRFCAVFLPIVYKNVFNARWTKLIILLLILFSLTVLTIFFQILPCRGYYNEQFYGFTYSEQQVCVDYGTYGDMGKLLTMCIFNVVVDIITIWKVRKVRSAQGTKKFQKKEIDFLKQSFSQAIYLLIAIPSWYMIPLYTTSRILLFVMGSLFWPFIHTFDGVLTLYFNAEIRKALARKFGRNRVSVTSSITLGGKSSTRMY